MSRSKSSGQWLQEHFQDEYVKKAQALGYRSRAVFKLQEIQEKDRLIQPDFTVVDLGAAPGGWSQYARQIVGKKNRIIALDILEIETIEGVDIIQGDFREQEVLDQLNNLIAGQPINLVLSDMAPNMSGSREIDVPKAMYLCELALDTARTVLVKQGSFLVKVFQGDGFEEYLKDVRNSFNQVAIRKPKASRARSNEVYLLAKGFKG